MEGTAYVPMVQRAWELFRKLEADAGVSLLRSIGNLTIGPPDGTAVSGFLRSAETYDIAHELLTASEVRRRWPALVCPDEFVAGLETEAGILDPERAVEVMLAEAASAGADVRSGDPVSAVRCDGGGVVVDAASGRFHADVAVVATGARPLAIPRHVQPKRVPVVWFLPEDSAPFEYGAFPVNFWQLPPRTATGAESSIEHAAAVGADEPWEVYSLPVIEPGGGVKVAAHNRLADCDPDSDPEDVTETEIATLRRFVRAFIPRLADAPIRSQRCFYADTLDGEFVLGSAPDAECIFVAACAGHGFKFAPALGEILADLATGRTPAYDISRFSPREREIER